MSDRFLGDKIISITSVTVPAWARLEAVNEENKSAWYYTPVLAWVAVEKSTGDIRNPSVVHNVEPLINDCDELSCAGCPILGYTSYTIVLKVPDNATLQPDGTWQEEWRDKG